MSTRTFIAILILAVVLVLQVTVMPHIEILEITPHLIFAITIAWALTYGLQEGIAWAVAGGILVDLFSATPMGATSLALIAAVLVIVSIERLFPENRILVPLALGALASFIFWFVYLLLLRIFMPVMITSLDYLSVAGVASGGHGRDLISDIARSYGFGGAVGTLVLRTTLVQSLMILSMYLVLSAVDRVISPKTIEI